MPSVVIIYDAEKRDAIDFVVFVAVFSHPSLFNDSFIVNEDASRIVYLLSPLSSALGLCGYSIHVPAVTGTGIPGLTRMDVKFGLWCDNYMQ